MPTDDCARARAAGRAFVLDFGKGDDVEGNVAAPDGDSLVARPPIVFTSMLRLRTDFIANIVKSAVVRTTRAVDPDVAVAAELDGDTRAPWRRHTARDPPVSPRSPLRLSP